MATKHDSEAISAYLEEWTRLRQEMTQVRFCEERGLSQRTFRSWVERFEPKIESPGDLVAKARALVAELNRIVVALQPQAAPVVDAPQGRTSGHPDHRWFF